MDLVLTLMLCHHLVGMVEGGTTFLRYVRRQVPFRAVKTVVAAAVCGIFVRSGRCGEKLFVCGSCCVVVVVGVVDFCGGGGGRCFLNGGKVSASEGFFEFSS